MYDVTLETATGQFVRAVKMPAFKQMPGAIRWGDRYFFRQRHNPLTSKATYREDMVWVASDEIPADAAPALRPRFDRHA